MFAKATPAGFVDVFEMVEVVRDGEPHRQTVKIMTLAEAIAFRIELTAAIQVLADDRKKQILDELQLLQAELSAIQGQSTSKEVIEARAENFVALQNAGQSTPEIEAQIKTPRRDDDEEIIF